MQTPIDHLESKQLQYHIKLAIRWVWTHTHGVLNWRTPELQSTRNSPMLQANSSSGAGDPAQMVKLFAKFWDQESGVFLVLKQKIMTF